jgi:hypothetical protein
VNVSASSASVTRSAVVDRLRLFLNRPLSASDRPRLFAIAVVLILAAAGLLAVLHDTAPSPPRAVASHPPVPPPTVAAEPAVLPSSTPTVPSEEGTAAPDALASPAEVRGAKRVARRFLAGYLPYSYGRGSARQITGADPRLRSRLVRERPRVPASERRRRPRVGLVQSDGAGRVRARLVALVDDGRRRYTVALELARTGGGWRVTAVGG